MQNHVSRKKLFLVFMVAVILVMAGLITNRAYENHLLTQKLKEEEIYMFRDTYSLYKSVAGDITICAYYMVCEPVDGKIQLVEKLERLMKEKQVLQGAKDYYQRENKKNGHNSLRISVDFYRPSKEFPIGWQPEEGYSMEDYQEILDYKLLSIHIPWDAKSEDDHTYYFVNQNTPSGYMEYDTYKGQTLEDGSFILIPKK